MYPESSPNGRMIPAIIEPDKRVILIPKGQWGTKDPTPFFPFCRYGVGVLAVTGGFFRCMFGSFDDRNLYDVPLQMNFLKIVG